MPGLLAFAVAALSHGAEPATPDPAPTSGRPLLRIIVTDSLEAANTFVPAPEAEFVVLSPGLAAFNAADLNTRLASGLNRIIDERLLAAIAQVIETFLRQNNHPNATVVIPTQSIAEGVVRVIAQPGPDTATVVSQAKSTNWKIRNINIPQTRWFSESLLRQKLRIEQGGLVRFDELDRAIDWTNNNSFRRIRVRIDPVPNTDEADLTIAMQEALPLRLSLTLDNAGNAVLGQHRFILAATYANLWGLDHQLSYQYITTETPNIYQGHGLDYRVPLPWRHYFQISGTYLKAKPEIYDGLFLQEGETITTDLRYTMPVRTGINPIDLFASIGFKETNNNLTWDPRASKLLVQSSKTNIFQFTLGGSAVRRDKLGAWALGASATFSPGDVNSRNRAAAFGETRPGADPRYVYGSVSLQRLINLKGGWDLSSRLMVQASDDNLLPSEQLSIGGGASVRGYPENLYAGDQAFVFVTELISPALKRSIPRLSKTLGPLETRGLIFYDAANSEAKTPARFDPVRRPLASAGLGVRMALATNFSLQADYGWRLASLPYQEIPGSRGHIRVSIAY
ncbi:MAG: ShlB/FhaC/HecB family hemolysin secretion/activation protein [Opitutaceae bacterium]|nr:ShlB/FhaC/HecB family hemolysin secretion/activation protein [Opitutaceae bacterium]